MSAEFTGKIDNDHQDKTIVPTVDMHLHLVNFFQMTEGLGRLLAAMDAGNIARCVVFGLPVKKTLGIFESRRSSYSQDKDPGWFYWPATDEIVAHEYSRLGPEEQKRLAPSLCGFNPTDPACIDYIEFMFEKYPFWKGIGEVICRHDDLAALHSEETAGASHPALTEVFKFCARKQIPLALHQNSTSAGLHHDFAYLQELRGVLDRHPETTFVWCHCGCSRRVSRPDYYHIVSGLLHEYLNLHLDFSWVVYEDVMCEPRRSDHDPLVPKMAWIEEVVLPYSDRVMLGSDLCGWFDRLGQTMARYNGLLAALPDEVRDRVARLNAERLWFKSESFEYAQK